MVVHESRFRDYLGSLASADRYVKFLNDVSNVTGLDISPASLRSSEDVEKFAVALKADYAPKSVSNYRSVMRKYVEMVQELGLK